jgi:zinc transporter ZupT
MLGLALHNTPIAIAFATLLKDHHTHSIKVIALLVVFSLMAPFGLLTSYFLGTNSTLNLKEFMPIAYGLVIGIFLHISTVIMFEGSENHKYNLPKILVMLLGVFLAFIIS